ncbi:MAG: thioredoxin domain-containing protein [Pseudomonadota bacterium]
MNRLASERSLYLQQHKDNPVDWWPWSEDALDAARSSGKPILLSIGYSACHWCHVMAHESFDDDATAALMNEHFINIKVDREERPDIDKIYQTAHQLMIQRAGGWPLTMFLTPDEQLPFFGGTYFPPTAQQGMPSFQQVLEKVHEFFSNDPAEAANQGSAVRDVFAKLEPEASDTPAIDDAPATLLRQQLESHFDAGNGGFGRAPKFPQVPSLQRALNHWRATASSAQPDLQALLIAALSQTRMLRGGLFDQIDGGFFRYCVDAEWQIPHFEKMLYDNGQLLSLLANTARATGEAEFTAAMTQTADWLLRDMRHPDGAFFATLDADTADGEGFFYTFTRAEITGALDSADLALAVMLYGLDQPANFEGRWHLTQRIDRDTVTQALAVTDAGYDAALQRIRTALRALRSQRHAPGRDEKILTGWNALTIKGLCAASRVSGDQRYAHAATQALAFIREHLWDGTTLRAGWLGDAPMHEAYLDDYALLIDALLEQLQTTFSAADLHWAIALCDTMLARFADAESGGLYFTANTFETLMYRSKPISDDATPAGNAVAARVLIRLGHMLANTDYLQAAERILQFARPAMAEYPQAHVTMIEACADWLAPVQTLVLTGDDDTVRQWQTQAQTLYAPQRMVIAQTGDTDELPPALTLHSAPDSGALAYLCDGTTCRAPISSWSALANALRD